MGLLQRLTTQYVDTEDRIRLAGENADGAVQVVWLTQRLLGRLVPAVCQHLAPGNDQHAELISSFRQQAAQAGLAPQAPVHAPAEATQAPILRVDLTPTQEGLYLVFHGEHGEQASIVLPELVLRQWLVILRDQYRLAEWPEQAWPAWVDGNAVASPAEQRQLH
jgi:hypothetical protein